LGDLGITHRVHLWLDGKRVVDFLLAIIAIRASSHGCGTIIVQCVIGYMRFDLLVDMKKTKWSKKSIVG